MVKNESQENYLETILILSKSHPTVRSIDISNELGFKKSSVSVAMKNLRAKNYITVTEDGFIALTKEGRSLAEMVYDRHRTLTAFLTSLGVPSEISEEDACKLEHVISPETFAAIKKYLESR